MTEYQLWLVAHGAMHGHCPVLCENPQPIQADDGDLICGMCAVEGIKSIMVPCTPDTCTE